MDRNRLIKLLNLSASENDHEALIAIRKANEMVNGYWDEVIGAVDVEPETVAEKTTRSMYDDLLETQAIIARTLEVLRLNHKLLNDSGKRWFGIMERNFEANHMLSDRQLNVLQSLFEDVKRKIIQKEAYG